MSDQTKSAEEMADVLIEEGWVEIFRHVWASPSGALFRGPNDAYRRMREYQEVNDGAGGSDE